MSDDLLGQVANIVRMGSPPHAAYHLAEKIDALYADRIEELEAENERLRKALARIVLMGDYGHERDAASLFAESVLTNERDQT